MILGIMNYRFVPGKGFSKIKRPKKETPFSEETEAMIKDCLESGERLSEKLKTLLDGNRK